METSWWLTLIAVCLALVGIWLFWPFLAIGGAVGIAAWKRRQVEKKEALRTSTAWPRR